MDAKIKVHLRPLGAAPPLAKPKIRANRSDLFAVLINHVRSQVAAAASAEGQSVLPDQAIHCFLANSFSPSPTQRLDDLFECFATGDELVILYSLTPSFG